MRCKIQFNAIASYLLAATALLVNPMALADPVYEPQDAGSIEALNKEAELIQIAGRWYALSANLVIYDNAGQQLIFERNQLPSVDRVGFRLDPQVTSDPKVITHIWIQK